MLEGSSFRCQRTILTNSLPLTSAEEKDRIKEVKVPALIKKIATATLFLTAPFFFWSPKPLVRAARSKPLVADHRAVQKNHPTAQGFVDIPDHYFQTVRDMYDREQGKKAIFYAHTSHGSQVMDDNYSYRDSGMDILEWKDSILYAQPDFDDVSDDLGSEDNWGGAGGAHFEAETREILTEGSYTRDNPKYSVVIWAWCGGVSSFETREELAEHYLDPMERLEQDFPSVTFVYMTGHLESWGDKENRNNDWIREYSRNNNKVLYDFADIERHDLDGNEYPDEGDYCGWCDDWCSAHPSDCQILDWLNPQ